MLRSRGFGCPSSGGWSSIQLARDILFNSRGSGLTLHLTRQTATIHTLIENFGPKQFVLVSPQGDPISPKRTAWAVPQTPVADIRSTFHPLSWDTQELIQLSANPSPICTGRQLDSSHFLREQGNFWRILYN